MEHPLTESIENVITTADLKEETVFYSHAEVKETCNDSEIHNINIGDPDYESRINLIQHEGSTTGIKELVFCSHDKVKDINYSELEKSYINIGENSENVSKTNLGQFSSAIIHVKEPVFCSEEEVDDVKSENICINIGETNFSNSQSISEKNVAQFEATTDSQNGAISNEGEVHKFDKDSKSNVNSIALECGIDSVIHNIERETSKHVDKDSESNEADQLEIEAEDEGKISDGIFTDEINPDSGDIGEINNETVKIKISKKKLEQKSRPSLCEDDKETEDSLNDDIEEGEVKDDTISVAHCRFFARGHCMFGNLCKNMHMTDKGLYKMFESDKTDSYVRPMRAHNPRQDFVSLPLDAYVKNCLPPAKLIEFRDLAWERGLRLAKQQQRQALERRNDPDFDEKYLYMNLKESPPSSKRKRRASFERHHSKLNCIETRATSDDHKEKLQNMRNATYEKRQDEMHKKGNRQYEHSAAKKRKLSAETKWRDPWRRSKSPTFKIRSHSRSLSSSDSSSSSCCSSLCSYNSKKHYRGKYLSKKRASTKNNTLNNSKSKHLSPAKRCISPRSCSRSSSRSLSSTPTDVLRFREQVYRNKPVTSFESTSQQKLRYPGKSREAAISTSNINNYKPPGQEEIHKMRKSRKSSPPNKTYRRSASQSSSCHSCESQSKSSCSSISYCNSNSCTSNYSRKSDFSSYAKEAVKISKYSFTLKDELSKRDILRGELNKRANLRKSKSKTKSPTPRKKAHSPELKSKEDMPKLSFKFLPKTTEKLSSYVPKWLSNVDLENSVTNVGKMSDVISSKQTMQNKKPMGLNAKKVSAKPVTGKFVNMLLRYQDLTKRNKEEGENKEIVTSLNQTAKDGKQITKNGSGKPKPIKKVVAPKAQLSTNASKVPPSTNAPKAPVSSTKAPPVGKSAQMLLQYRALTKKNKDETENNEGAQSLQKPKDIVKVKNDFYKSKNIPENSSKGKNVFKEPRKISEVLRKKEVHPLSSKNLNVAAISIKPQMSQSKAMQRSKSHIAMNLITDVSDRRNLRSGIRKPVAPSTMSIAASKLNLKELGGSRRDILLKQLKAVEAAIARKRSK